MANPVACAAGIASLSLLKDGNWSDRIARIERQLQKGLEPARALPDVRDVRVLGSIGVIEMRETVDPAITHRRARETGV